MLPKRKRQVLCSGHRPLVRNRRNASSCQALRESQSSHREECFHASLVENQFLVRPTNHSTTSDTTPLCTCMCILLCTNCFLPFAFGISLVTRFIQFFPATNHRIYICLENQLISYNRHIMWGEPYRKRSQQEGSCQERPKEWRFSLVDHPREHG